MVTKLETLETVAAKPFNMQQFVGSNLVCKKETLHCSWSLIERVTDTLIFGGRSWKVFNLHKMSGESVSLTTQVGGSGEHDLILERTVFTSAHGASRYEEMGNDTQRGGSLTVNSTGIDIFNPVTIRLCNTFLCCFLRTLSRSFLPPMPTNKISHILTGSIAFQKLI